MNQNLTKDTLQFLSRRFKRSLTSVRTPTPNPDTGQMMRYKVQIPDDKLDLLVGTTLENRYYVLSLLGKGGMSLVYKAKDLQSGLVVAVKCLRTQALQDEMVVKRFKREADVLNRLNHPRIVNFFGYGTNLRGQPYFVMDYLVGTSLGEILRTKGALDLGRFQDIFVQVAAAIGHAHKHGAVHRDIKPGNIMLVEKGGTSDYVKIVDFGIAKVTEGTQQLTRLGEVWGSPIYMSPEQCMGTTIDARSDIYSLGIVMYEALTGEVPFLGRNYADTMMKQISEEAPTLKEANPKVDIPQSLEKIIFRAIKKKPDERYQTMGEIKHDLERALNENVDAVPRIPSSGFRTISGRQEIAAQLKGASQSGASLEVTADHLPLVDASTMQQRVTSEDMQRYDVNAKPPKPFSKAPKRRKTKGQPESGSMNFAPNTSSHDDRAPFQLTGPQVIAASTTTDEAKKVLKKEERPRRNTTDSPQTRPQVSEGRDTPPPPKPPRERESRNRLPASISGGNQRQGTAHGARSKALAADNSRMVSTTVIALGVMIVIAMTVIYWPQVQVFLQDVFMTTDPADVNKTKVQEDL